MINKVDFALIITARKCNPNGDPILGNIPRQDIDGFGEMSSVCLKRKIRNRLLDMGQNILVKSTDPLDGNMNYSIKKAVDSVSELKKLEKSKRYEEFFKKACETWFDVRAFGQVFALKQLGEASSIGIRGPVSIGIATTLEPVDISQIAVAKTTNWESNSLQKDKSTIGEKWIVNKGVYVAYGAISPQLADKTGFSENDVELLKQALIDILENDASDARPSGSMESTLIWAHHNNSAGVARSAVLQHAFNIQPSNEYPFFVYTTPDIKGLDISVY